jgi:histidine triad (HIT) family protein
MGSDACVFCEVISGSRPVHQIHADSAAFAFLDARPVFKGHLLVVPTAHASTLLDLTDPGPYFAQVQRLTGALERGLGCDGALVAINHRVSQSVPHLHTHIIPRRAGDGLRGFFWPRTRYESDAEAEDFAGKITAALL